MMEDVIHLSEESTGGWRWQTTLQAGFSAILNSEQVSGRWAGAGRVCYRQTDKSTSSEVRGAHSRNSETSLAGREGWTVTMKGSIWVKRSHWPLVWECVRLGVSISKTKWNLSYWDSIRSDVRSISNLYWVILLSLMSKHTHKDTHTHTHTQNHVRVKSRIHPDS